MNKYSAISWREKDTFFYEMIIRCLLCTRFSWIFIVLAHWNNNPGIDMLFHSDTLSWYQPVFGPLRHIILIPTRLCSTQTHYPDTNLSLFHSDTLSWYQPVLALAPYCYMFNEEETNTNFIIWFDLTVTKIYNLL